MSTLVKAISLRTTYEGNLEGLHRDLATLKSIRRQLQKQDIRIPVTLDLSGLKSQAVKAATEARKILQASMGGINPAGSGVSRGGIFLPPGAVAELENYRKAAGKEIKRIESETNNGKSRIIQSFEQLEKGIQRVTTTRQTKTGKSVSRKIIDTTPVQRLQSALDQLDRDFAARTGAAKGSRGDVAAVLAEQKARLQREIGQFANLEGTSEFRRASRMLDRLDKQISQAVPQQERMSSAAAKQAFNSRADRIIARRDRSAQTGVKRNKEEEATARAIADRVFREREINRVLDARDAIFARQQRHFERLTRLAQASGMSQAAGRFENAGFRAGNERNQLRVDRTRESTRAREEVDAKALERRLSQVRQNYRLSREKLATEEATARQFRSRPRRERALEGVLQKRADLQMQTGNAYRSIETEAERRGNRPLVGRAQDANSSLLREGERDMRRLEGATRGSGHALNFHTNSLLKNAATFAKWYVPAQAAMGVFNTLSNGARDAIAVQRTFKVLNAVFRGTREEAEQLAIGTLMLASANGRSTGEAAQSAVQWSRLGLTRIQSLTALETSLRAANVAEISAADATKYLTANYKAFGLTISDLPVMLDYLNSLSNKYNVTVNDLFQGLARSGKVAQQAGVSYQELAAIIATVSDSTGRPGAEIGNSIKSTLNRLARPEVGDALKAEFKIDTKGATGDLKRATEIMSELAALYPTLNRLEQARLTNLVAGSLQSNRFTVILENYTDALIAQANAGLDVNSSQRESAEILSSLDAQIQSVRASWVAMLYALGEKGAFEAAGSLLKGLSAKVGEVAEAFGPSGDPVPTGSIRPENKNMRLNLARSAKIYGMKTARSFPMSPPEGFEQDEVRAAIANLRSLIALREAAVTPGVRDPRKQPADFFSNDAIQRTPDERKLRDAFNDLVNRGGMEPVDAYRNIDYAIEGRGKYTLPSGDSRFGDTAEELNSELNAWLAEFEELLKQDTQNRGKLATTDLAKRVVQRQTAVQSLNAGQAAFNAMARDFATPGADQAKVLRQFDAAIPLLASLEGGLKNVAEARLNTRPLLEGGQTTAGAAALRELGDHLGAGRDAEYAAAEKDRAEALERTGKVIDETRAKIRALNQEQASTNDVERQKSLQEQIEKTNSELKNQEEQLRGLNRGADTGRRDLVDPSQLARVDEFFRDTKLAAESIGEALASLGNTGLPNLDAKIRIGAARLEGDLLQRTLDTTRATNAQQVPGIRQSIAYYSAPEVRSSMSVDQLREADKHLESLRQQLALHQEIESSIAFQVTKIRETTEETERKLEIERQAAELRERFEDGAASANAFSSRFAIGRSEGEQLVSRQRGLMDSIGGEMTMGSIADPWLGESGPGQSAREAGQLTANLTAARQGLASIEERMNRAIADRANLEYTITEESRKQREEATKRLALASREDQLRAAAAAAVLRNRGQSSFSLQEFQFFGDSTRQAISNLNSGSVKGLDDSDRENSRRRGDLDREIGMLAVSLRTLREQFDNVRPSAEQKAAGLLDQRKLFPRGADGNRVADQGQQPFRFELRTGNIDIRVDFDRQIDQLRRALQTSFDAKLDAALRGLPKVVGGSPDNTPAVGAF